ncbi:cinnamoyl-CoA reductase-like SNL6 [Euphorbia lathyris]|uniref:cinnamoyl-CoA reductase-like SNL6 n=1 Tax=Euphorbia lathyris TaxID=212925 RepID=UPI0033134014
MGFVETEEEIEELKRMIVACVHLPRRKDHHHRHFQASRLSSSEFDLGDNLVCVTSGASFLGIAIVNTLLSRGYSVRIILHTQEEMENLRDFEINGSVQPVMAKLTEIDNLIEAFQGCRAVFHTAAFTDPAGLSGYTKSMGEVEVKACENVIRACSRTASVRSCVLTSSLVSCIWRDATIEDFSPVINHDSWSDESLCIDKKLWYALGKVKAEKAAWRIAKETGLKMASICPGLITGPDFFHRNSTATIAYLKGAQEMYKDGILATVDVMKLAEAHACVFEALNKTAFGRYICFDQVIEREDDAENLAKQIGLPASKICGGDPYNYTALPFHLSNKKLLNLMSTTLASCANQT